MPKAIVGFVHEPNPGVLAAAIWSAVARPPPGAAGTVAKLVLIPKAALKASAWAPPFVADEAACCPRAHAVKVSAGAWQLVLS